MHQQRLAQVAKILIKAKNTMNEYLYQRYVMKYQNLEAEYANLDNKLDGLEYELKVLARKKT